MSSIFTYNPSPPKPASPWSTSTPSTTPSTTPRPSSVAAGTIPDDAPGHLKSTMISGRVRGSFVNSGDKQSIEGGGVLTSCDGETVTGLASEPQMGPTEYKLSLSRGGKSEVRLEQLTTQLLWRLQQSSPYHATSLKSKSPEAISSLLQESQGALYEIGVADDGTFIGLSEEELDSSLETLKTMAAKLGCGVKVVRRVCVGEVTERDVQRAEGKLADLLKMRARNRDRGSKDKDKSSSEGEDDKIYPADAEKFAIPKVGQKLWVAEAFVKPGDGVDASVACPARESIDLPETKRSTEQLRISLTGATTSGKSTLLGTLTTGDLDNGRGKSRLSLLRHRHELVSGVTSSVAWEIVGYKPEFLDDAGEISTSEDARVINYASGNISSWTDIHASAEHGRIVFISDSAGHPRYRRTSLRSLVGWAPHYAALLIPANDDEENDEGSSGGSGVTNSGLSELSQTHLELCIKLGLRMFVLFTKMDLASKTGFRKVFSRVLSLLKDRGRKPVVVTSIGKIESIVEEVAREPDVCVPIVFTSSVRGDGVDLVHELLRKLPVPDPLEAPDTGKGVRPLPGTSLVCVTEGIDKVEVKGQEKNIHIKTEEHEGNPQEQKDPISTLFHIEEIYGLQPSYPTTPLSTRINNEEANGGGGGGVVVSGHLRYGKISVGDELVVGPFPTIDIHLSGGGGNSSRGGSRSGTPTPSATPIPHSAGCSSFLSTSNSRVHSRSPESADEEGRGRGSSGLSSSELHKSGNNNEEGGGGEWRVVRVVSVRRLRLPVGTLFAGEAGTLGVLLVSREQPTLAEEGGTSGIGINITTPDSSSASDIIISSNIEPIDIATSTTTTTTTITTTPPNREVTPGTASKAVTFAAAPSQPAHTQEPRLRKGMVILNRSPSSSSSSAHTPWPKAYTSFTAILDKTAIPSSSTSVAAITGTGGSGTAATTLVRGSHVVVYIASVRAAARICSIYPPPLPPSPHVVESRKKPSSTNIGVFGFDEEFSDDDDDNTINGSSGGGTGGEEETVYGFEFLTSTEWVEFGGKVLVVPGGGDRGGGGGGGGNGSGGGGGGGIEGFVGRVVGRGREV